MNVNELQVFEKEEFGKVRVIESNNDVWFVAKDVSEILDYNTTAHMTRLLEDDEKGVQNVDTPGGSQKVCIINESGLYHAVITSRKAEAKKFRKWVTSEVLPSIRKTGSYTVNVPKTFAEALRLAADQQEQIEKQQQQLIEQAPKVKVYDNLVDRKKTMNFRDMAAKLSLKQNDFMNILKSKYIYKKDKQASNCF